MRILIFRSGAYGDNLIITPVIRYLKSQGHELIVVTSKRGMEVFKNNPHIERLIQHKEEIPIEKLADNIEEMRKKFKCEKVIDFSESVEVALSQHPRSPNYKLPKAERRKRFDRNFYEYAFEHAQNSCNELFYVLRIKENGDWKTRFDCQPELFFDKHELYDVRDKGRCEAADFVDEFKFNILLGMSGSGGNKAWPWMESLAYQICDKYPDVHIITVGDEKCRLIEPELEGRITNLSGKIPMRMSMELTGLVDLVIAPDTGIIHAAGCYETPKICLLGHNTIEGVTKHFTNDYSVEADPKLSPCAPCLYLVYDKNLQCPTVDACGGAVLCMSDGITIDRVFSQFERVYAEHQKVR
jgi:ADP-heptose:LPS heptosyltransferase